MNKLIKLLQQNARFTTAELAVMLGLSESEVAQEIKALEQTGVIRAYKAIVDWEKCDSKRVTALIEIKVTPQRDSGFDEIARRIMEFEEVESVYLMSGGYDLAVMLTGKTFQQVAMFVSTTLAPFDGVMSTSTHFVLRRYKELDVILGDAPEDDRKHIT